MTRVTVDAATRAKLGGLQESLELCDESGQLLGSFTPANQPAKDPRREPQISEEEIRRREQANERDWTTAEVLAHLEKLSCTPSTGGPQRSTN